MVGQYTDSNGDFDMQGFRRMLTLPIHIQLKPVTESWLERIINRKICNNAKAQHLWQSRMRLMFLREHARKNDQAKASIRLLENGTNKDISEVITERQKGTLVEWDENNQKQWTDWAGNNQNDVYILQEIFITLKEYNDSLHTIDKYTPLNLYETSAFCNSMKITFPLCDSISDMLITFEEYTRVIDAVLAQYCNKFYPSGDYPKLTFKEVFSELPDIK